MFWIEGLDLYLNSGGNMEKSRHTLIIDLTQPLKVIWRNIQRKRRGDIKRAKRKGVTVEIDSSFKYWDEWFTILKKLHKQLGIPIIPWLFRGQPCLKKEDGTLIVSLLNNEVLAGEWYIPRDKTLFAHINASKKYNPSKKTLSGNAHALLIWEAIKWGKKQGFKKYDFCGYNPEQYEHISKWKASFGGYPCYTQPVRKNIK